MFKITLEHEGAKVEIRTESEGMDSPWEKLLPFMFDALKGMGYSFNEEASLYVDNKEQM